MPITRRSFIQGGLGSAALLAAGCSDSAVQPDSGALADLGVHPDTARIDGGAPACKNPFAGGTLLGTAPFVNEGSLPLDTLLNSGWDGRLYTDLSRMTRDSLITPNDRFFVRTQYPDLLNPSGPWKIRVRGLVSREFELPLADLQSSIQDMGTTLLECSGNGRGGSFGLLGAARWSGIPFSRVLDKLAPSSGARRVLVSGFDMHSKPSAGGHSKPGASWVFTLDQLSSYGAYLATHMNGVPLPRHHGFPVRLIVPRWYGCTNIKWVDEIRLVDDTLASTAQMQEFASRTHQSGVPALARDFKPAVMGHSAMPVRVEKWNVKGQVAYRVVGVLWGGDRVTSKISIRFNPNEPYVPVDVCPAVTTNDTWTLWSHRWTPAGPGTYEVRLRLDEPGVETIRLDSGFYRRWVRIA
jgi:DMSO/TMAO reductase YedYZ molybdopterin-dependent catalytic subunit